MSFELMLLCNNWLTPKLNSVLCSFVRHGEGYIIQSAGRLQCVFLFVRKQNVNIWAYVSCTGLNEACSCNVWNYSVISIEERSFAHISKCCSYIQIRCVLGGTVLSLENGIQVCSLRMELKDSLACQNLHILFHHVNIGFIKIYRSLCVTSMNQCNTVQKWYSPHNWRVNFEYRLCQWRCP